MPHDEPDETDPMMLVGVALPADEGSALETVQVFAEEFARMGFDEVKLMKLFRSPIYAGAHRAYLAVGEDRVRAVVHENVGFWTRVEFRERDSDPDSRLRFLPVLDGASEKEQEA